MLRIGDRFVEKRGKFNRYDRLIWRVMKIEETHPGIVHYACRAEGTIDWWYIVESTIPEMLANREIKVLDAEGEAAEKPKEGWADALDDPATGEAVKGFIANIERQRPADFVNN